MMNNKVKNVGVYDFNGCQLPCIPQVEASVADFPFESITISFKRYMAYPWNRYVKQWLKKRYYSSIRPGEESPHQTAAKTFLHTSPLKPGDRVRVRSLEEIESTLDPYKELKGCAFLHQMHQYCGTEQKVFKIMERFLDERDYKVKKTKGLILLENNFCNGTPVFGPCDRSCFLFWREEWLEKIE
jgi:hypothetical protein